MRYVKSYNELYNSTFNELNSMDEGFKEIALTILMLAGGNLNAQNKEIVKKSLDNIEIVQNINNTINDKDKLQIVINKVSNKLPQAGKLIKKNADKVKAKINNISKEHKSKIKTTKTSNVNVLINRLRQGYAISDIEITKDTILPEGSILSMQENIEIDWSSDNFFKTGTFDLTSNSIDSINLVLSQIIESGGKIIHVDIISSTDKEPIKIGNDKLAELRANGVKLEVNKTYDGELKVTTIPNSGDDLYSKDMTNAERKAAREKTSKYRYVKLKIIAEYDLSEKNTAPITEIVDKFNYKLVKIYNNIDSGTNSVKKTKHKTFCKGLKIKHNGKYTTSACPIF